ncbi:Glutamate--tRNA ligase, mitochondrial [Erysiphe neolycopersici]|uniref:Glutamate--tRNA ligase, mitochondrial n=1 Tax=Erysiphe neolycopersici TaxID=212602 RepID=A0A420HVU0_9PEZI|nr:Glutamate--tRNA ligase, mitochondrial [Erysiphe neolycopersici]
MIIRFLPEFKSTNLICKSSLILRHISTASGTRKPQSLSERGPARTRFAPSPTGYVHLGSLRTALFNYLVAKATGGQFILRIEDTDQKKRTVPDAIQRIYEDLRWAGIHWDEGPNSGGHFGPYQQSERLQLYFKYANKLLESGNAYRCFCTPIRLEALATNQTQLGLPRGYDRCCAHISNESSDVKAANGDPFVIRLKAPDRYPSFSDLVYGFVKQKIKDVTSNTFDDPILLKSDGFPTYHFANVVDDHLMQITDVIRGAEWMSSTHKHIAIYEAFGWEPPTFSHVGLLLDESKRKLSKRKASMEIANLRSEGIFPESLTNFVALLGWSHELPSDVMSMKKLIEHASMKFTKGDTVVNFNKLYFLQRRHAARYASAPSSDQPLHSLYHLAVIPIVKELDYRSSFEDFSTYSNIALGKSRCIYVQRILEADAGNYTTPKEFILRNIYFFVPPSSKTLTETMSSKIKILGPSDNDKKENIETLLILFRVINEIDLDEWHVEILRGRVNWIIEQRTKMISESQLEKIGTTSDSINKDQVIKKAWGKFVHQYLRWALCADKSGPDGITILFLLGKQNVSERLRRAEEVVKCQLEEFLEKVPDLPIHNS